MTQYQFYTLDVFTEQIFGGNPLAVFPNAEGLSSDIMQKIAAEFNLSETVFVLNPQTAKGTKKLRIFTPKTELPFAGHPTVGTAYLLAYLKVIPLPNNHDEFTIIFEEGVGQVPVKIRLKNQSPVYTELTAAQLPEFRYDVPSNADLAKMLSLETKDILSDEMSPEAVSCGVPFVYVPLSNKNALKRAKLNKEIWEQILSKYWANSVYLFTEDVALPDSNLRARMFAPSMGIEEDPATGAAATSLAGYLGVRNSLETGILRWTVEQGFEMGRPSILYIEADKKGGNLQQIRVGGSSVLVSEGVINI